jgi:hypothetical protein
MQAYCVKCRTKRDVKNPKAITFKNGRPATQGVCPVCGTKIFRIGKTQSARGGMPLAESFPGINKTVKSS